MKVFMLIKWLNYTGAPKMFMWLAHALAESGHDVRILTFMQSEDVTLNDNLKWTEQDLRNKNFFGRVRHIRTEIKKFDADVCISFLLDANVYNMFACKGLRTKSVVCERNDPFKPGYWKLKFWKPFFRLADGAVYQLDKVRKYYDNITVPTAVIPNPIVCHTDISCNPFSERKKAIVTHGRLDLFQKRQDVLIGAFAKFVSEYPDYELHIFGAGPDEDKIIEQITRLGLTNKVKLMGVAKSPQKVIKNYQIYVLPSDFEGIPNALIEALSVGLPCIATDCRPGGSASLIQDGVNGFLIPMGNEDALYQKLVCMIEHPDMADQMGKNAMNVKQTLAPEKIIKLWNSYLNQVLNA